MAAVVSLGLALSVVPRQVKPWTGMLLMYEWTFTIFILLFGGYLHLIRLWGKTVANQQGSSDYDSGKGLLTLTRCKFDVNFIRNST